MEQTFWTIESAPVLRALDAGESPVLVSGVGAAARAHMAAALRRQTESPLFVLCPDDAAAETMRNDLASLLDEPVNLLQSRELAFYSADSASRAGEQKRLAALDALARGAAPVTVCTAAALLQRAIPKEKLLAAAFDIADGQSIPMEDVEKALLLPEGDGKFFLEIRFRDGHSGGLQTTAEVIAAATEKFPFRDDRVREDFVVNANWAVKYIKEVI